MTAMKWLRSLQLTISRPLRASESLGFSRLLQRSLATNGLRTHTTSLVKAMAAASYGPTLNLRRKPLHCLKALHRHLSTGARRLTWGIARSLRSGEDRRVREPAQRGNYRRRRSSGISGFISRVRNPRALGGLRCAEMIVMRSLRVVVNYKRDFAQRASMPRVT